VPVATHANRAKAIFVAVGVVESDSPVLVFGTWHIILEKAQIHPRTLVIPKQDNRPVVQARKMKGYALLTVGAGHDHLGRIRTRPDAKFRPFAHLLVQEDYRSVSLVVRTYESRDLSCYVDQFDTPRSNCADTQIRSVRCQNA